MIFWKLKIGRYIHLHILVLERKIINIEINKNIKDNNRHEAREKKAHLKEDLVILHLRQ